MPQFRAFTLASNGGILRVLISRCHACAAFDPKVTPPEQHPKFETFDAIWDTGATASVITRQVVDACGLKPTGMKEVHGVHGKELVETFLINIGLPNKVAFVNMEVTLGKLAGAHMLIGMDIITRGDFSITNVGDRTVFSFRVPSLATVDFVKQPTLPKVQPGRRKNRKRRPWD